MPDPANLPEGCKFHPRCKQATAECSKTHPDLVDIGRGHMCRCLHVTQEEGGANHV